MNDNTLNKWRIDQHEAGLGRTFDRLYEQYGREYTIQQVFNRPKYFEPTERNYWVLTKIGNRTKEYVCNHKDKLISFYVVD